MALIKLHGYTRFSLSAGKVRYITPVVERTRDKSFSKQGRCKYRMKYSNNVQFNSGSFRMFPYENADKTITNSYQNFNTQKGYERIEYFKILKQEEQDQTKNRNVERKNSKRKSRRKWYKNHPIFE